MFSHFKLNVHLVYIHTFTSPQYGLPNDGLDKYLSAAKNESIIIYVKTYTHILRL